ncbi:SDR family NAD(P)-dependent oxidoreductase [Microbacterium sp. NPDC077663]|uniref:SDR family NAD(P)-dependent oxidoreductase n=1 Tax=Microbacterium sp. NPDC077663 TaxID=3364189 RepID=UPI0037C6EABB
MKVWFITGASGGFGREWTIAALERGDSVIATARAVEKLADLVERFGELVLPLRLDVDDRTAVFDAVAAGVERFGRIDVVVSNAGYGQYGLIEEVTEREIRDQFETNVFGSIWVLQAVLPILRAQRSGRVIQVSSIGGVTVAPQVGIYNATKWAIECVVEALAGQVAGFGIRVTLVEPQGYSTEFSGSSARRSAPMPEYDGYRAELEAFSARRGDPKATRQPILELVDMAEPPLRQFFGITPLGVVSEAYEARLAEWRAGQDRAVRAFGDR